MDVGKRIRLRRKELNMSVDELAKRLGKNRATIYRYENGDIHNLPVDILEPLSKALETTPQNLLGWMSEENVNNRALNWQAQKWYKEFGHIEFEPDELDKLMDYVRFLISQRKEK